MKRLALFLLLAVASCESKPFLKNSQQQNTHDSQNLSFQKTIEIPLEDYHGIQFYGQIFVGSNKTPITVIFDTGSSRLWIPSASCEGCSSFSKKYNHQQSLTYKRLSESSEQIKYGKGDVFGNPSEETICFSDSDNTQCLFEKNFLLVTRSGTIQGLQSDGVLGLAPKKDYKKLRQQNKYDIWGEAKYDEDITEDELEVEQNSKDFIHTLQESGLIQSKIFSMHFADTDEQDQKIIFGGYDILRYGKRGESLMWHNLSDSNFWSVSLTQARIGDKQLQSQTKSAILDTGTSYILVPKDDFDKIIQNMTHQMNCGFDTGSSNLYYCRCLSQSYADFPSLFLKIDDKEYEVPSTSYMTKRGLSCYFKIVPNQQFSDQEYWVLGDVFLQNYYSIYDYENDKVGLIKSNHIDSTFNWRLLGLFFSVSMIILGVGGYIWQFFKDYRLKRGIIKFKEVKVKDNTRYEQV